MPDNWGYVLAAYALTALALGFYWRRLVRKEKSLHGATMTATRRTATGRTRAETGTTTGATTTVADTATAHTERPAQTSSADRQIAELSREPSRSGHPRIEPTSRGPLQP